MLKYKFIIICLAGLYGLTPIARSQIFSEKKEINRTFPVRTNTKISVNNKYGNVHFEKWEKDSVRFEIIVNVSSENKSKIKDIIDEVRINFSEEEYIIKAITEIGKKRKNLIADFKKIAESLLTSESQIKIDYKIILPFYSDIELTNKYGDVYIGDHKGDFTLVLSYGNLNVGKMEGNCDINYSSGFGSIASVSHAELKLTDVELEIINANQLNIKESMLSELKVGKADIIRTNSRRDKYFLTQVGSLFGETNTSDLHVNNVIDEINVSMKYGSTNINLLTPGSSIIDINSQYTDIYFETGIDVNYKTEIEHIKIKLIYPDTIFDLKEESIGKGKKRTVFSQGKANNLSIIKIKASDSIVDYKIK